VARECKQREADGDVADAAEARRKAVVDTGALVMAECILQREIGGCPSTCRAACLLIIGASGGAGCADAAADTQAPLAVLQLLSSTAQTREQAGGWLSRRSGVGVTAWSAAFEALLALAGLDSSRKVPLKGLQTKGIRCVSGVAAGQQPRHFIAFLNRPRS
jgi:hypothetical protein